MSNHFTGLSLGPPGDQRLDLCDLYAFQSPADPRRRCSSSTRIRTPTRCTLTPSTGSTSTTTETASTDIAISYVFSAPQDGRQRFSVFVARGEEARSAEAVGERSSADAEVSFGTTPNSVTSGPYTFFAGAAATPSSSTSTGSRTSSTPRGGRNFTAPHLGGKSPWTGVDSNTEANVFSTVVELPTE